MQTNKGQTQQQLQLRLKTTDDTFHGVIIALERLERFLLMGNQSSLQITAISTDRDFHDDQKIVPTRKLLYSELQLQCSSLFFLSHNDDIELKSKTINYFLADLLMWYGGRGKDIAFDDVDKFFIPIVSALSRQVNDISQLQQTVEKYVQFKVDDITTYSDEDKRKAVEEGWLAITRATEIVEQRMKKFMLSAEEVEFTIHQRGTIEQGLERLYAAFLNLYKENTPVLFLDRTRKKYLADIGFDPLLVLLNCIADLRDLN